MLIVYLPCYLNKYYLKHSALLAADPEVARTPESRDTQYICLSFSRRRVKTYRGGYLVTLLTLFKIDISIYSTNIWILYCRAKVEARPLSAAPDEGLSSQQNKGPGSRYFVPLKQWREKREEMHHVCLLFYSLLHLLNTIERWKLISLVYQHD